MKAYVLVKNGAAEQAFELQDVPEPEMKPGHVLIQSEGFGINFADVMARNGLYREAPPLPAIIGYEIVGRVKEVGPEADQDLLGKRVVAMCRFGGYAERVSTDHRAVAEIPEDMPLGQAASLAVNYNTAHWCFHKCLHLEKGDRVLIHSGAGGVGLALVELARRAGCEIFATAGNDEKLALLKEHGVQHPINYRKHDYEKEIKRILGKGRLEASFNALGGSSFKKDMNLIGSGGSVVMYGGASRAGKGGPFATLSFVWSMGLIVPIFLMMRSKSLIGVNMLKLGDFKPDAMKRCLQEVIEQYRNGQLDPHPGTLFKAEQIADAHALLESRKSVGKIALSW